MTATDIGALLRQRYALPEWVIAFEVLNGTGAQASRSADAVAINCYPSKGCEIVGLEVKVSRGDWLRELKASDKAVAVGAFCDRWYVVATDAVVKREELPIGWGLIVASDAGLRVAVQPPANEAPKTITRSFLASMLRSVAKVDAEATKRAVDRANDEGFKAGQEWGLKNAAAGHVTRDLEDLRKRVREFEGASGISIERNYGCKASGAAVKAFEVALAAPDNLRYIADRFRKTATALDECLSSISTLEPRP